MRYFHEIVEHPKMIPAKILHQRFYPTKRMKQHVHEEIEIAIPLNGYFVSHSNGENTKIEANTIFLANHNTVHYFTFPKEHLEGIEVITLLLSYQSLKECYLDIDNYIFVVQNSSIIKDIVLKIDTVYTCKEPFYEVTLHALIYQLYAVLLKECLVKKEALYVSLETTSSIQKVIEYIDTYYYQPLSLSSLGKEIGFSSTYISRHFKESCGITISEYIRKIRLQHSHEDLLNTNLSITKIALDNGFPNVKSFIMAFKEVYQVTPQVYRKLKQDKK